ncbi:hypothetical protein H312_03461 [Anncaliia algerae PRA339]|uniref:DNA replication complex GINS protein SLD5 n=1 Tax=Anncaliia algerae PRA339 TaxID=1288291 RepID=A0A059EW72_9MICR|nr:hypothetical protein H312_03461 [Anncaliia algerae PRA339]
MHFGESANKLIQEIKRISLKNYNKDLIQSIEEENKLLKLKLYEIEQYTNENELTQEITFNFLMINNYYKRNLRILRMYKYSIINLIIDEIMHNKESDIPLENKIYKETVKNILLKRYDEFDFLDFSFTDPPLKLYVQVYTKKDCGVIIDGNNIIELKCDRFYFVKKCLVEHLLALGYVEIIE